MSFKFCSLSSGSSGNSQYIETPKTKILVDAGLSGKKIKEHLESIDVCASSIDSILVTHEHVDHIKGVGILSRRYDIPIYANEHTWNAMKDELGKLSDSNIRVFKTGKDFEIGDIGVKAFNVSHDAAAPVGYSFFHSNKKLSVVTDTGEVQKDIRDNIIDSNLLMIESNHDKEMLKIGNYPWFLKQRVSGEFGHLSNEDAGNLLLEMLRGRGETVLLGHLSRENNFPELAYQTVSNILRDGGVDVSKDISLCLTHRDKATRVYEVN